MADLATMQAQLETLRSAKRAGVSTISYEGKSVTYRSFAEMGAAILSLESEIAALTGSPNPRNINVRTSPMKGW